MVEITLSPGSLNDLLRAIIAAKNSSPEIVGDLDRLKEMVRARLPSELDGDTLKFVDSVTESYFKDFLKRRISRDKGDEIRMQPRPPFEVEGDQVTGRVLVRGETQE